MATYTTNFNLEKPEASDPFGDFRESYNDNLDIIDANLGGGGGSSSLAGLSDVDLTTPTDGQVLTYDGNSSKWVNANGGGGGGDVMDVEVNGVSVVDGNKVAKITSYKEVTQAQYDALPASKLTDGIAYFIKDGGGGSGSGGSFLLVISADTGETVTATKDGTTFTATEVSTGVYEVEVTSAGTWTLSDGTNTETVDVGVYTATIISAPDGSTVTPTDDVTIWLACGRRTETYTTLGEVLADSTCLLALMSDNNAIDYLVRSLTWINTLTADSLAMTDIGLNNYCADTLLADSTWCSAICNSAYFESVLNAKVPAMTDNTHPIGACFGSTFYNTNYDFYKAFDGSSSTRWNGGNSSPIENIGYQFEDPVAVIKVSTNAYVENGKAYFKHGYLQGSDDGVTWSNIAELSALNQASNTFVNVNLNKYAYNRIYLDSSYNPHGSNYYYSLWDIQFYGREDI